VNGKVDSSENDIVSFSGSQNFNEAEFWREKHSIRPKNSQKSTTANRIDLAFFVPELESSDLKKRFIGPGYPVATNKPKE
jgi:hypothetical protein